MLRPNSFLRVVSSALLIVVFAAAAMADTLRLKDGSIIKGTIVEFSEGRFVVVVGQGSRRRELSFSASDVESVTFDSGTAAIRRSGTSAPVQAKVSTTSQPPRVVVTNTETAAATPPVTTIRDDEPTVPSLPRTPAVAKPIEVSVTVLADNTNNGWTNSGWVVRKGQRIRISGSGEISIGGAKKTSPAGLDDFEDPTKLLKAVPTGALIAVIGDDNNDFIYIGESREFIAERDGPLFLGVNEGNLNDNSGTFSVTVQIAPESD